MFIAYQLDKRSLGHVADAAAAAPAAAQYCLPTVVAPICGTLLVGRLTKPQLNLLKRIRPQNVCTKLSKQSRGREYDRGRRKVYIVEG